MVLSEQTLVFFGFFGLGCAIAYAAWTTIRTRLIREKLFAVREELWLKAYENEWLNDPAYLDCRERIHAYIAVAELCNVRSLTWVADKQEKQRASGIMTSENRELNEAIREAIEASIGALLIGMLFYRVSGWVWLFKLFFNATRSLSSKALKRSYNELISWLKSDNPEHLEPLLCEVANRTNTSGASFFSRFVLKT